MVDTCYGCGKEKVENYNMNIGGYLIICEKYNIVVGGWHGVNGGFVTPRRAKEDCYVGTPVSCLEDVETQFLGIRERVPQRSLTQKRPI